MFILVASQAGSISTRQGGFLGDPLRLYFLSSECAFVPPLSLILLSEIQTRVPIFESTTVGRVDF